MFLFMKFVKGACRRLMEYTHSQIRGSTTLLRKCYIRNTQFNCFSLIGFNRILIEGECSVNHLQRYLFIGCPILLAYTNRAVWKYISGCVFFSKCCVSK